MIIKKVEPMSLAKILGIIYAVIGLIAGIFFSLVTILGAALGTTLEGSPGPMFGLVFGFGAVFAFPILYGVLGFLAGLITGGIYNIVSGWVGGIEIDLEEKAPASDGV